ncbi:MAG: tRNA (guanosine(37)-N1)-methyltransferase TrmD [Anaerolineales bacterium]|nr:tRNA (guanosine(37)-N1)-methyltransferase TrmD [Anaerolineales bacterium]
MRFDIFTLFPSMFDGVFRESILKRGQEAGLIDIALHDIRAYTIDKHHVCDDTPYGGGGGMVLKPGPIFRAVESVLDAAAGEEEQPKRPIILLTPQGRLFTQEMAVELAHHERLVLICGRYEGVDERVRQHLVSDEISIGDYVLTGGELAAMVIVDAVVRQIPGVLGARWAAEEDSHATGLLEGPHYTRPGVFREWPVPEVLLSGDHARIERWRRQEALRRTWQRRPDLLRTAPLSDEDRAFLATLAGERESE